MIYALTDFLAEQGGIWDTLRVLNYVSTRSIAAVITTLLLVIFFAPRVINMLYLAGQRDSHRDFHENIGDRLGRCHGSSQAATVV